MKQNIKINMMLMLSFLIIGISACKKDKKTDPEPQPVEVKAITITDLRALSTGASVKVPDGRKVKGIVISDVSAKNIDSKTVVLQEATDKPAIIITFDAAQSFAVGDEVEVTISNQTLAQANGEIILQNIPAASVKKTGTGTVAARQTTIAEINTNKAAWNGTLVSLNATELTSTDSKYNGILTIKDASGSLSSKVSTGAAFENTNLPLSVLKVTGLLRMEGANARIDIRNANDVSADDVTRIEVMANTRLSLLSITDAGRWNPVLTDAAFLEPTIRYPYMITINTLDDRLRSPKGFVTLSGAFDKTAKFITITFAGSTMKGDLLRTDFKGGGITPLDFNLPDFNSATHNIKIGIGLALGGASSAYETGLIAESPIYTETGKFFTLKVRIPTEADLQAKGISAKDITDYFNKPGIMIYNLSSQRGTTASGTGIAPVVISKVEVGY